MLFTPLAGSSCGVDLWGRLVGSKLAERSPKLAERSPTKPQAESDLSGRLVGS